MYLISFKSPDASGDLEKESMVIDIQVFTLNRSPLANKIHLNLQLENRALLTHDLIFH